MQTSSLRRFVATLAACDFAKAFPARAGAAVVLGLASAAGAQVVNPTSLPPPPYSAVDSNGVDLATGLFQLRGPQLSIGAAGSELGLQILDLNMRTSVSGKIVRSQFVAMGPQMFTVSVGDRTAMFLGSPGGPYTLYGGAGAQTLTGDWNPGFDYTNEEGAVFRFVPLTGTSSDEFYLSKITRPDGEVIDYHYASTGPRLLSMVSSLGWMLHFEYKTLSGAQRLKKITALNLGVEYCGPTAPSCTFANNWPSLTFSDRVTGTEVFTITDAKGQQTTITPSNGLNASIQSPAGVLRAVTFGNSTAQGGTNIGRVTSFSNGQASWAYSYSSPNWSTGRSDEILLHVLRTDPLGHTQTVKSKTFLGQPFEHTNGVNKTTSFNLQVGGNGQGRINSIQQPESDTASFAYDDRQNITGVTWAGKGGGGSPISVSAIYPPTCSQPKICNKPTSITDERGGQTDFEYSVQHGGVTKITRPAGQNGVRPETRYTYTALYPRFYGEDGLAEANNPVFRLTRISECRTLATCAGTADELVTTITYEPGSQRSNLLPTIFQRATGDGSVISTEVRNYDYQGNLVSLNGPAPGLDDTTFYRYDAVRNLIGIISPDPDGDGSRKRRAERFTYNGDGKMTLHEIGWVDGTSDPQWAAFTRSSATETIFGATGLPTRIALKEGTTERGLKQLSYDAALRLECEVVRMNVSAFGSTPGACTAGAVGADGPDRITSYSYDAADRLTGVAEGVGTDDARNVFTYRYSDNGKIDQIKDGLSNQTTLQYDALDRLSHMYMPDRANGGNSSTTDYISYDYLAGTRLVSSVSRIATSETASFTYDLRSNRISSSLPTATTLSYDNHDRIVSATGAAGAATFNYDALGRLTSESGPAGTMSYLYDSAGRRIRATWPDAFYVTYSYTAANELEYIRDSAATALTIFGYDNLGRRNAQVAWDGRNTSWNYDGLSRVTRIRHDFSGTAFDQQLNYEYNAANQITLRTSDNSAYTWPRPTTSPDRLYTHNGRNEVVTSGGETVGRDGRGNVTSYEGVTFGYNATNQLVSASNGATLTYDGAGRLFSVAGSGSVSRFLYSGAEIVGEYDAAGTLKRRYINGPGIDDPILWYEPLPGGGVDRRWLSADHLGSIVAVTTEAGVTTPLSYDEYGLPGQSNMSFFQYGGQAWIAQLGLYNMKARFYSASLGRFMQPDPIGFDGGPNLYAYVGNDPLNRVDPYGLQASCVGSQTDGCVTSIVVVAKMFEKAGRFVAQQTEMIGAGVRRTVAEVARPGSTSKTKDANGCAANQNALIRTGEIMQANGETITAAGFAVTMGTLATTREPRAVATAVATGGGLSGVGGAYSAAGGVTKSYGQGGLALGAFRAGVSVLEAAGGKFITDAVGGEHVVEDAAGAVFAGLEDPQNGCGRGK